MPGRSEELADCRHPFDVELKPVEPVEPVEQPVDPVEPAEEQPMDPVEPVEQPLDPIESQVSKTNEEELCKAQGCKGFIFWLIWALYGYFDSSWFLCAKFLFRLN